MRPFSCSLHRQQNMDHKHILEFLNNECRRKDGYFKPHNDTFKSKYSEELDYIRNYTSFLDVNAPFPQRAWHVLNSKPTEKTCPICGNTIKWGRYSYNYATYCGPSCSSQSEEVRSAAIERSIAKSGYEHHTQAPEHKAAYRKLMIERYGVSSFSQTDEFKARSVATFLDRYGVTNPMKNSQVKAKTVETNMVRYGASHALKTEPVKQQQRETNMARYGGPSPTNSPEVRSKQIDTMNDRYGVANAKHMHMTQAQLSVLRDPTKLEQLCEKMSADHIAAHLDVDVTTVYGYIHRHGLASVYLKSTSGVERMVAEYVGSLGVTMVRNTRSIIAPLELDIYLPEHNIAIEVNGVYFHSEIVGKGAEYHYNKWRMCYDKGIQLLSYFDDEINASWPVIKAQIAESVGKTTAKLIYAQDCMIDEIEYSCAIKDFVNSNSIYHAPDHVTKVLVARYGERIAATLCLEEAGGCTHIVSYACDIECIVDGMLERFVSYYAKTYNFKGTVCVVSDNCHSNGAIYKQAGFLKHSDIPPDFMYFRSGPREAKSRYTLDSIAAQFDVTVDGMTEWDLLQQQGYSRVWDCGKIKWVKEII